MSLRSDLTEIFTEQLEFRELLRQLVVRDLLLRYKQTVMGLGWAVLMPLLNTIVFSVIFMRVAQVGTPVPYPLFAYSGLLIWNFTASALKFAVGSLTANTNLVTKVFFPREIFPFSSVLVSLVDFGVASTLLFVMMAYYGVRPTGTVVLLPLVLLVHVAFTAALALLLSMANLFYRDVKYLFEIVLTVWMFASSVVYPVNAVGGAIGVAMRANPMTVLIEAYRRVLLYGQVPDGLSFAWTAAASFAILVGAWLAFHRSEFWFAENI